MRRCRKSFLDRANQEDDFQNLKPMRDAPAGGAATSENGSDRDAQLHCPTRRTTTWTPMPRAFDESEQ